MKFRQCEVDRTAERLGSRSPSVDFAYRAGLAKDFHDIEDPQDRMGAYCLVVAGAGAPVEYARQLAWHDMVSKAVDERQPLVAVKQFVGESFGWQDGRSFMQVFIPRRGVVHEASTWEGWSERSPVRIEASASMLTYGDRREDTLAHTTAYILEDDAETRYERRAFKDFFKDGRQPPVMSVLEGPQEGKVWFKNWLVEGEGFIHIATELEGRTLHGLYTPDSFIRAFAGERRRRRDQMVALSSFALALAQMESEEWYVKNKGSLLAETLTFKAGPKQFANGRNISEAISRDLVQIATSFRTTKASSQNELRDVIKQRTEAEETRKQELIDEKLRTLDVTITEFGMETGSGTAISLEELYEKAEAEGYFIYEFRFTEDDFSAVVGDKATLEASGISLDQSLSLGEMMATGGIPSSGPSRELAVQRALDTWHTMKAKRADNPFGSMTLFATALEGGQLAKAFIPDTPSRPLEAVVEVTEEEDEVPHTTFRVKMQDAPVFGVSKRDQDAITRALAAYFALKD